MTPAQVLVQLVLAVSCQILLLPMLTAGQGHFCSLDHLQEGLKYNGEMKGLWAVTVGSYIRVNCYGIYNQTNATVLCKDHQLWDHPDPPCILNGSHPGPPPTPNGTHPDPPTTPDAVECESPPAVAKTHVKLTGWEVGDQLSIYCTEGFWYDGTNPRVCQDNRTWSGHKGSCQAVRCPTVEAPPNGIVRPPPPYGYNTSLEVSCQPGYVYFGSEVLRCLNNNTWNGTVGMCKVKSSITCKVFQHGSDVVVKFPEEIAKYEDMAEISCHKGFTFRGLQTRTCQADGTWSGSLGTCIKNNGGEFRMGVIIIVSIVVVVIIAVAAVYCISKPLFKRGNIVRHYSAVKEDCSYDNEVYSD